MADLAGYIGDNLDPDPDVTAGAVMDAAGVPRKWRALFWPVVHEECRRRYRAVVHAHENDKTPPGQGECDAQSTTVGERLVIVTGDTERRIFLTDRMALDDGRFVVKGDATVADWESRIRLLTKGRDGLQVSIDYCVDVADFLRGQKVSTLNDYAVKVP